MPGKAGRSGRIPQPTALRVLNGNPGKRRLNDAEPRPRVAIPRPPASFSTRAKREWGALARELVELGVLTTIDRLGFAALISSYVRWREAEEDIAKRGLLLRDMYGRRYANPMVKVARDAQAEYTRMLPEFGLTPSSRSRIVAAPPVEDDEFEALLRT